MAQFDIFVEFKVSFLMFIAVIKRLNPLVDSSGIVPQYTIGYLKSHIIIIKANKALWLGVRIYLDMDFSALDAFNSISFFLRL